MSDLTPSPLLARWALAPDAIERESHARIEAAVGDRLPLDPVARAVARRIVYAAGDLALADAVRFSPGATAAAVEALRAGCAVVTDVRMVAVALNRRRLDPLGGRVVTVIDDPAVVERARASGLPRAAEAMRHLAAHGTLDGALVVIGNAPTALLALLDLWDAGTARPACVVGLPVGFVAAAESKAELLRRPDLPHLTLPGTRGGSPLAAAATNALIAAACRVTR